MQTDFLLLATGPRDELHFRTEFIGCEAAHTLLSTWVSPEARTSLALPPALSIGGRLKPGMEYRVQIHAVTVIAHFNICGFRIAPSIKANDHLLCIGIVSIFHKLD